MTDLPGFFIPLAAALFGLAVGSFLNVCILRIPKGESVVFPASHCPKCGTPIRWYDNIPILSWLVLRGRCRVATCRARISLQYPAVELLTGALFLLAAREFGLSVAAAKWIVFFCILLVHIVTDLRARFLSYRLNQIGFVCGLIFGALAPVPDGAAQFLAVRLVRHVPPPYVQGIINALLGALLGAGLLWVVLEGYFRIAGRPGMGLGDVYLMGMAGSFLGPQRTMLTILLGSVLGSILGVTWIGILYASGWKRNVAERAHRRNLGSAVALRFALARRYPLPFGTYLGIAAVTSVFFGTQLLNLYWELPWVLSK